MAGPSLIDELLSIIGAGGAKVPKVPKTPAVSPAVSKILAAAPKPAAAAPTSNMPVPTPPTATPVPPAGGLTPLPPAGASKPVAPVGQPLTQQGHLANLSNYEKDATKWYADIYLAGAKDNATALKNFQTGRTNEAMSGS